MISTSHDQTRTSREKVYRAVMVENDDRAWRVGVAVAVWAIKYKIDRKTALKAINARLARLGFVGWFPRSTARSGYLRVLEVA